MKYDLVITDNTDSKVIEELKSRLSIIGDYKQIMNNVFLLKHKTNFQSSVNLINTIVRDSDISVLVVKLSPHIDMEWNLLPEQSSATELFIRELYNDYDKI